MLIKKEFLFGVMLLSLLLISIITIAAETNNSTSKELNLALGNIKCRTDFTSSVINTMISIIPSDALTQASTKLGSDYTQLQTYSDSGDKDSFRNYIKNNYDPDLKSLSTVVQSWRQTNLKNLTIDQKKSLKDDYTNLKTTYDTCHLSSLKDYGTGRINAFNSILDGYQTKVDNLKSKGIDTTSLQKVIDDAKSQIIQPMQNALATATDETTIRQVLQGYCMFDGCKNGINYHLAAKFELAKLDIALTKIKANSNVSIVQDNVTQLETEVNNAKTELTAVGTSKYTDSGKQIWDNIKAAYQIVKDISMTLGGKK